MSYVFNLLLVCSTLYSDITVLVYLFYSILFKFYNSNTFGAILVILMIKLFGLFHLCLLSLLIMLVFLVLFYDKIAFICKLTNAYNISQYIDSITSIYDCMYDLHLHMQSYYCYRYICQIDYAINKYINSKLFPQKNPNDKSPKNIFTDLLNNKDIQNVCNNLMSGSKNKKMSPEVILNNLLSQFTKPDNSHNNYNNHKKKINMLKRNLELD